MFSSALFYHFFQFAIQPANMYTITENRMNCKRLQKEALAQVLRMKNEAVALRKAIQDIVEFYYISIQYPVSFLFHATALFSAF